MYLSNNPFGMLARAAVGLADAVERQVASLDRIEHALDHRGNLTKAHPLFYKRAYGDFVGSRKHRGCRTPSP